VRFLRVTNPKKSGRHYTRITRAGPRGCFFACVIVKINNYKRTSCHIVTRSAAKPYFSGLSPV
jgi:hypothetical protein